MLAQLGNQVQHALRAFTAKDQKAVKAAAETFRANPDFRVAQAITELAVGEALVSMLEDKGTPGIVQRTLIAPPASRVGPALTSERQAVFAASPMAGRYDIAIDRQSAYEQLRARAETLVPREAHDRLRRRPLRDSGRGASRRRASPRPSPTAPLAASAASSVARSCAAFSVRCSAAASGVRRTPLAGGLAALVSVILIDIALAGDNAIVVGMAAAELPRSNAAGRSSSASRRRRAAHRLRSFTVQLLQIIGLLLAGGILLLWVAWKLWREIRAGKHREQRRTRRRAGRRRWTAWKPIPRCQ